MHFVSGQRKREKGSTTEEKEQEGREDSNKDNHECAFVILGEREREREREREVHSNSKRFLIGRRVTQQATVLLPEKDSRRCPSRTIMAHLNTFFTC